VRLGAPVFRIMRVSKPIAFVAACVFSIFLAGTVAADPADLLRNVGADSRRPLYLTPMMAAHQKEGMRAHLVAVQRIIVALQRRDYAAVSESAREMGFSPGTGEMCEMMGAATPGFSELAFKFHHTADEIGVAANKHDEQAVLTALGKTLAVCTTCHSTYAQKVVSTEEWNKMAREPAH